MNPNSVRNRIPPQNQPPKPEPITIVSGAVEPIDEKTAPKFESTPTPQQTKQVPGSAQSKTQWSAVPTKPDTQTQSAADLINFLSSALKPAISSACDYFDRSARAETEEGGKEPQPPVPISQSERDSLSLGTSMLLQKYAPILGPYALEIGFLVLVGSIFVPRIFQGRAYRSHISEKRRLILAQQRDIMPGSETVYPVDKQQPQAQDEFNVDDDSGINSPVFESESEEDSKLHSIGDDISRRIRLGKNG